MATLDRVIQLQQQGMSDTDITNQLRNEGVSPAEINDSINQAKIKNAVSPPDMAATGDMPQGAQPSIMPNAPQPAAAVPAPEIYPPQGQPGAGEQPLAPMPAISPQEQPAAPMPDQYAPQEQDPYYQATPQAYSDQDYYGGGGGAGNTETISEIAEQVATEKLNDYKKKVGDVASFKNNIQDKVNDIDDRLKRIEGTIDKLQQAIIGKIGEFGESNAMIHKDLENLHGTVGKLMNPLVDTYNELKKK